jgi:hypothetical protein
MSLNLKEEKSRPASAYSTSQSFIDAVNDSQFVRSFGMAALVGSILGFLFNGALTTGIGLAVIGFGATLYYRLLGLSVVILAASPFLLGPLGLLGQMVLSVGVGLKSFQVLSVLAAEGKGDPDWGSTQKRALTGMVLSIIALVVAVIWFVLSLLAFAVRR